MADLEYDRSIEAEVATSLDAQFEVRSEESVQLAAAALIESFGSDFPPELKEVLVEIHVEATEGAVVPLTEPTD